MSIPGKIKSQKNLVNICVDGFFENDLYGRIYHYYRKDAVSFRHLVEMFKTLDRFYDEIRFPQATVRMRRFTGKKKTSARANQELRVAGDAGGRKEGQDQDDPKEVRKIFDRAVPARLLSQEELLSARGERNTFYMSVYSRTNASWQGEVYWVEQDESRMFVSDMELMALLDNAMRGGW